MNSDPLAGRGADGAPPDKAPLRLQVTSDWQVNLGNLMTLAGAPQANMTPSRA